MFTNATAPDLGAGPWTVAHNEWSGTYYLYSTAEHPQDFPDLNGEEFHDYAKAAGFKAYPLGKTAYREARKRNEETPAAVAPKPAPKRAPAPKAPKVKAKAAPAPKPAPAPKVATPAARKGKATHSTVIFQGTREEWLNAFTAAARPIFADLELKLPEKIRVSVGFPHRGRKNTIGQCWHESASADGTREIFVIPTLDDSERIADVLTHELAHTLFGPDEKHGKNFKAAVTKLGLEGKATATVAGPGWQAWALPILEKLGPIPHAAIDTQGDTRTKQKTYLVKGECEDCGFVVRLTAKWVNAAKGTLQCPDSDCSGFLCVETEGEGGE